MNKLETTDIVLAAYLKVIGCELQEIQRTGNRGTFVFNNVNPETIKEYDLGRAQVEPKALNYEIKALTTAARR